MVMKHENEIVDSRVMLRIISGLLAAIGLAAVTRKVAGIITGAAIDWGDLLLAISSCYGILLFGGYALTGKLLFMRQRR